MRKTLSFLFRLLFVGACVTFAFWDLDPAQFGSALASVPVGKLIVLTCYSMLLYVSMGLRLNYLTRNAAGFIESVKSTLVCLSLNNVFPAKAGEVAKAFYLSRITALPLSSTLGLVFWERFFDLNILLLISIASLMLVDATTVIPLLAVVGGGWVAVICLRLFPLFTKRCIGLLPSARVRQLLSDIAKRLHAPMNPGFFAVLGLYSLLFWSINLLQTSLAINWLGGHSLTFFQLITVFAVSVLGYAVPSSPGALGVFEAALVLSMGWFGIPKEQALVLALVLRCITYIPQTLLGLWVVFRSGLTLSNIRQTLREAVATEQEDACNDRV